MSLTKFALVIVAIAILLIAMLLIVQNGFKSEPNSRATVMIDTKERSNILEKKSSLTAPNHTKQQNFIKSFELELAKQQGSYASAKLKEWSTLRSVDDDLDMWHVLMSNTGGKLFIQAPHQFSDRFSGEIALAATSHSKQANALFLNAQHRKEIDYSREPNSILTQLTQVYLQNNKMTAGIVQLHGFERTKRKSAIAQSANFIISSGNKRSLSMPLALQQCLVSHGFENVLVYGREVDELGATKNPVKKQVYQLQSTRFVHIEMSLEQRKALIGNAESLAKFYRCIDRVA